VSSQPEGIQQQQQQCVSVGMGEGVGVGVGLGTAALKRQLILEHTPDVGSFVA
jgi:hypothetical protein